MRTSIDDLLNMAVHPLTAVRDQTYHRFMTEADLCQAMETYLEFTVGDIRLWFEPPIQVNGRTWTPDIIALAHGNIAVIEAKLSLTHQLIDQCTRWMPFVPTIYALVPEPKRWSSAHAARRELLIADGIGLFYCNDQMSVSNQIVTAKRPRVPYERIIDQLSDTMRTHGPDQGGVPTGVGKKKIRKDKWDDVRRQLKDSQHPLLVKHLDFPTKKDRREFCKAVSNGDVPGITTVPHLEPRQYRLEP